MKMPIIIRKYNKCKQMRLFCISSSPAHFDIASISLGIQIGLHGLLLVVLLQFGLVTFRFAYGVTLKITDQKRTSHCLVLA